MFVVLLVDHDNDLGGAKTWAMSDDASASVDGNLAEIECYDVRATKDARAAIDIVLSGRLPPFEISTKPMRDKLRAEDEARTGHTVRSVLREFFDLEPHFQSKKRKPPC